MAFFVQDGDIFLLYMEVSKIPVFCIGCLEMLFFFLESGNENVNLLYSGSRKFLFCIGGLENDILLYRG